MRDPASNLRRPVTALRRLQDLIGEAAAIGGNDRNPNQQAQLQDCLAEAWHVAFFALNGGPLPPKRDRQKAV